MTVFQVGLCKSNPMSTSTEVFDFDNSECVYVYKNDNGQLTGDIFSDNKTSLDSILWLFQMKVHIITLSQL